MCDSWEAAYLQFETPEEEIRKFEIRLTDIGAKKWNPEAEIVELFCGRGNGLHALGRLEFRNIVGGDLSQFLVRKYVGSASVVVCDGRHLPFPDDSKDVVIIQGGLHHLAVLPDDLERTLVQIKRILRRDGLFVIVEPWLTPFLKFVHAVSSINVLRQLSAKIDAFAWMRYYEFQTYHQWLDQPQTILNLIEKYFRPELKETKWGKLYFAGRKKAPS